MICTLMEKHGVLIFSKVETGNRLLIITILENNIAAKVILLIPQKTNLFHLNHMHSWALDGNDDWQAPVTRSN